MQAESGQILDVIIRRKELERAIGNGIFYWGIGNSLGTSMIELLRRAPEPEILFSVMRTKPKIQDSSPSSVLLWTEYIDANGLSQPLPPHALVLSRGSTMTGIKKRCYALVCYSEKPLSPSPLGAFDISHFRNLGGTQGKIGFSQVTANIEHFSEKQTGARYEISLKTFLKPPYFITLAGSKKVLDKDRQAIDAIVATDPTPDRWRLFVEDLRKRPEYAGHSSDLFTVFG
jgi:hypothetical protein